MAHGHLDDRGNAIVATTDRVDAMSPADIERLRDLMYASVERDLDRLAEHVEGARLGDRPHRDDARATANDLRRTFALLDQLGWIA